MKLKPPRMFECDEDLDALPRWYKGGWPLKDGEVWYLGYWTNYGPSCFRWNDVLQVFATDSGAMLDRARAPDFYRRLKLPQ